MIIKELSAEYIWITNGKRVKADEIHLHNRTFCNHRIVTFEAKPPWFGHPQELLGSKNMIFFKPEI